MVDGLRECGIDPIVKDTICFATQERQQAAKELAARVDAMIVLGGRNSSNTTRLFEICSEYCSNVHHVETPEEIDDAWFEGCSTVGLSAGASTPEVAWYPFKGLNSKLPCVAFDMRRAMGKAKCPVWGDRQMRNGECTWHCRS